MQPWVFTQLLSLTFKPWNMWRKSKYPIFTGYRNNSQLTDLQGAWWGSGTGMKLTSWIFQQQLRNTKVHFFASIKKKKNVWWDQKFYLRINKISQISVIIVKKKNKYRISLWDWESNGQKQRSLSEIELPLWLNFKMLIPIDPAPLTWLNLPNSADRKHFESNCTPCIIYVSQWACRCCMLPLHEKTSVCGRQKGRTHVQTEAVFLLKLWQQKGLHRWDSRIIQGRSNGRELLAEL